MNSESDAAIFLASFSFSRSAAHPKAITLTCIMTYLSGVLSQLLEFAR